MGLHGLRISLWIPLSDLNLYFYVEFCMVTDRLRPWIHGSCLFEAWMSMRRAYNGVKIHEIKSRGTSVILGSQTHKSETWQKFLSLFRSQMDMENPSSSPLFTLKIVGPEKEITGLTDMNEDRGNPEYAVKSRASSSPRCCLQSRLLRTLPRTFDAAISHPSGSDIYIRFFKGGRIPTHQPASYRAPGFVT
jgi:hypothetical protein